MLNVYVYGEEPQKLEIEHDVERIFAMTKLKGTEKERLAIQLIDKGQWKDADTFIDRFGVRLYTSELSTGCKAILSVLNNPDIGMDLKECGLNARDAVLSLCDAGNVLINDTSVTFNDYSSNGKVSIGYREKEFTTMDSFNEYFFNGQYEELWG